MKNTPCTHNWAGGPSHAQLKTCLNCGLVVGPTGQLNVKPVLRCDGNTPRVVGYAPKGSRYVQQVWRAARAARL